MNIDLSEIDRSGQSGGCDEVGLVPQNQQHKRQCDICITKGCPYISSFSWNVWGPDVGGEEGTCFSEPGKMVFL